jgi:hypothetical protein
MALRAFSEAEAIRPDAIEPGSAAPGPAVPCTAVLFTAGDNRKFTPRQRVGERERYRPEKPLSWYLGNATQEAALV